MEREMNIEWKWLLCAVIFLCGTMLISLFATRRVRAGVVSEKNYPAEKLSAYLWETMAGEPYVLGEIRAALTDVEDPGDCEWWEVPVSGTADVTWTVPGSEEEFFALVQKLTGREELAENGEGQEAINGTGEAVGAGQESGKAAWLYCQYKLGPDIRGTDIYRFLEAGFSEEPPMYMATGGGGSSYRFSQEGRQELIIKDGTIYGLICLEDMGGEARELAKSLLLNFVTEIQEEDSVSSGWVMDRENLYWADHGERYTEYENPERSFLEVLGREEDERLDSIMFRFGALKEADYRVTLSQDGPALRICFNLEGEIPREGYAATLWNGNCTKAYYEMTVTDAESGALLDQERVRLCVEKTDTVSFVDLDGDGHLDMRIDYPTHWNGLGAVMDEYAESAYMLWEPGEEKFVLCSEAELEARRDQNLGQSPGRANSRERAFGRMEPDSRPNPGRRTPGWSDRAIVCGILPGRYTERAAPT